MTRVNLQAMAVAELLQRFVAIAVDQDKAIFNEDTAKSDKLYDQIDEVINELKSRPGDQRSPSAALFGRVGFQME